MAPSKPKYKYFKKASTYVVDLAPFCLSVGFVALILIMSSNEDDIFGNQPFLKGWQRMVEKPCDEIYVVGVSETLHTISDKCGDPHIVERNPHVHDPDDVFPGLVIKIVPSIDKFN